MSNSNQTETTPTTTKRHPRVARRCCCGCGAETNPRNPRVKFRQGHDARTLGYLQRITRGWELPEDPPVEDLVKAWNARPEAKNSQIKAEGEPEEVAMRLARALSNKWEAHGLLDHPDEAEA